MKKFISGFVAGALLFGGTAAIAAQPGLIGQKVQSVFNVEKGGKKIAEAVAIDGTTYAPVRALADATGTSLEVEGKTIKMSDKTTTSTTPDDTPLNIQIMAKQNKLNDAKSELASWQSGKRGWEEMLEPIGEIDPETQYGQAILKNVIDHEKKISEIEERITQIESELAALEAQK